VEPHTDSQTQASALTAGDASFFFVSDSCSSLGQLQLHVQRAVSSFTPLQIKEDQATEI
jgi:hypothetical protein